MFIINGNVYHDNATIVNGRLINGSSCKFDETKKESANGVNRIYIDSDIDVKVSTCDTNDIIAHLHGSAITSCDIKLSMTKFNDEIKVCVKSESSFNCGDMSTLSANSLIAYQFTYNSSGDSRLTLDVQIPQKAFKKLSIESRNANIDVKSSVNANTITLDNKNGNIDLSAIFQSLIIDCKNGNIDVDSEACYDVYLGVSSKNGNVDVTLGNIGISKVSAKSYNGNCKNKPKLKGIYTVSGSITSKNGNVKFH